MDLSKKILLFLRKTIYGWFWFYWKIMVSSHMKYMEFFLHFIFEKKIKKKMGLKEENKY